MRKRRIIVPGCVYHVINRGNNREAIFLDSDDFKLYLDMLYRFKNKYQFKLLAFCLMTNHVHLLLRPSEQGSISKIMQSLTVAHTRHYHMKYSRCGHIWQGRFYSAVIEKDISLLRVMRYIEQNPVRAGMVARVGQYPFCSYRHYVNQQKSRLIDREDNAAYLGLGKLLKERNKCYRNLMKQSVNDDGLREIRKAIGVAIGVRSQTRSDTK